MIRGAYEFDIDDWLALEAFCQEMIVKTEKKCWVKAYELTVRERHVCEGAIVGRMRYVEEEIDPPPRVTPPDARPEPSQKGWLGRLADFVTKDPKPVPPYLHSNPDAPIRKKCKNQNCTDWSCHDWHI